MCPEIVARSPGWYTYARREPEKTALFQVLQEHLLTFEQEWTDKSDGRTLPSASSTCVRCSHPNPRKSRAHVDGV